MRFCAKAFPRSEDLAGEHPYILKKGNFMYVAGEISRRYQGEIIEWSDEKRCGFVLPRGSKKGDTVVFLSTRAFVNRRRPPKLGDIVLYEVSLASKTPESRRFRTQLRAEQVTFAGEALPPPKTKAGHGMYLLGLIYLLAQLAMTSFSPPNIWIFLSSLLLSAFSMSQYAWDKNAAKQGRWRVSESSLQMVAALGGWPGAAIAQQVLRHKTQKRSFQSAFIGAVILNVFLTIAAYYYLPTLLK